MKVIENKIHFTLRIKWKNVDEAKNKEKESLKQMKTILIGLDWMESATDLPYANLIEFHSLKDGICEATINDNDDNNIETNLEWTGELLDALQDCENIEAIWMLKTNDDSERIIINNYDYIPSTDHRLYGNNDGFVLIYLYTLKNKIKWKKKRIK